MIYLLDTNAYYLFLQPEDDPFVRQKLLDTIHQTGTINHFYLSQITSLEIHSVLGKKHRHQQRQERIDCQRIIHGDSGAFHLNRDNQGKQTLRGA